MSNAHQRHRMNSANTELNVSVPQIRLATHASQHSKSPGSKHPKALKELIKDISGENLNNESPTSPDRIRSMGGGRANSMATAGKKNVDGSQ